MTSHACLRLLQSLTFCALGALPAFASVGESEQRAEAPWPLYDVDDEGQVWVRGATYKASFGRAGATYIPFLGSSAPRNFPLLLRTSSVHVANEPLAFADEVSARREGARIEFDRGSFVERYDIEVAGMEQSFVFKELPARGEIVVSIDVETELLAIAPDGAIRFENELGAVAYGEAFALDAKGEILALETRLSAGRIDIVVPADFTARAALPLVIDPFITTINVDIDADDDLNPDVAFDTFTASALVVYEQVFSAADHDVIGRRVSGFVVNSSVSFDVTSANWRSPAVAYNRDLGTWLGVAEVGVAPNRVIQCRGFLASTLSPLSVVTLSAGGGDHHDPDIGGDATVAAAGETSYFVVWQRDAGATDSDVLGRLLGYNGAAASGVLPLASSTTSVDTNPSISKTNGVGTAAERRWTVAFEHEVTATNRDVRALELTATGSIATAVFDVAATSADERDPTTAERLVEHGAGRPWLVAYESDDVLRLAAISGASATVVDTHDVNIGVVDSAGEPDATTDGRLWQVAWRSTTGHSALEVNVRAASFYLVDGVLGRAEALTTISGTTSDEEHPRIASMFGFGSSQNTLIAYQIDDGSQLSNVRLGLYASPITAGDFAYCPGTNATCPCGNGGDGTAGCENSATTGGALLASSGRWFVDDDTAVLNVTQLPPGAPLLFFQGTAQISAGAPFGDGLLCVSGVITRMAVKFSSGGAANFPEVGDLDLSVAGPVPAVGGWRYYQAWHRDSVSFCNPSLFNLTNGVALLWAP